MPDGLLPFAFNQSRASEAVPPLNLSRSQKTTKRSHDSTNDYNGTDRTDHRYSDEDVEDEYKTNDSEFCNDDVDIDSRRFLYSSLNSSSSAIAENRFSVNRMVPDTSSTILNYALGDVLDLGSDHIQPLELNSQDIPSSPLLKSQNDSFNKPDPLMPGASEDAVPNNGLVPMNSTSVSSTQSIEQHPPLDTLAFDLSQTKPSTNNTESKFHRPTLSKMVHSISRHGSTFTEPTRKKQRMRVDSFHSDTKQICNPPPAFSKIAEFAIDRDGHVYGYNLETDRLPENYFPTLYDEPDYFVVKNTPKQLALLSKTLDELFEQGITSKNHTATLNLQSIGLTSLPDTIGDIKDYLGFSNGEILKPVIHIDASRNSIRSVNPKIFQIENLEMLSLRNNKIARLSGCIEHAHSLKSLNIAMNKLKFLPHNLLRMKSLEVLAINGNPMIPYTSVDKYFGVDEDLLRLYSAKLDTKQFLNTDKQIKYFSRIQWLGNTKRVSKKAIQANLMSRSLTTLQDMCYDDNGNINDWTSSLSSSFTSPTDTQENINKTKMRLRKEKQSIIESHTTWVPKLSELSLRQISKYLISQSEVERWQESTNEFVYRRAMSSLIYGAHGETCGHCNETCIESVADMLEWWDLKGSNLVTIKRRFCSKHCAISWMNTLNHFKAK
jgi:hypothetical protein